MTDKVAETVKAVDGALATLRKNEGGVTYMRKAEKVKALMADFRPTTVRQRFMVVKADTVYGLDATELLGGAENQEAIRVMVFMLALSCIRTVAEGEKSVPKGYTVIPASTHNLEGFNGLVDKEYKTASGKSINMKVVTYKTSSGRPEWAGIMDPAMRTAIFVLAACYQNQTPPNLADQMSTAAVITYLAYFEPRIEVWIHCIPKGWAASVRKWAEGLRGGRYSGGGTSTMELSAVNAKRTLSGFNSMGLDLIGPPAEVMRRTLALAVKNGIVIHVGSGTSGNALAEQPRVAAKPAAKPAAAQPAGAQSPTNPEEGKTEGY